MTKNPEAASSWLNDAFRHVVRDAPEDIREILRYRIVEEDADGGQLLGVITLADDPFPSASKIYKTAGLSRNFSFATVRLDGDFIDPYLALETTADRLQELLTMHLFAAWPECPIHPGTHPLSVNTGGDLANRGAFWICPKQGRVISNVGELSP